MKLASIALLLSCLAMADVPVQAEPEPDAVRSVMPSYFGKDYNTLLVVPVTLKKFNGDFTRRHGNWSSYYRAYTVPAVSVDHGIEVVFYDEIAYRACMAALEKTDDPVKLVGYETLIVIPILHPTPYERVPEGEKDVAGMWTVKRVFVVLRVYQSGRDADVRGRKSPAPLLI
ncbi:hypothetical protein [Akkermansia glycaniphila]|uniref:Uncharacterized protein n=1 Tax=Akkermansia glycaniphila TaxID=1679444 RepID=A0A1H6MIM0_9BACT|nr:hypothetical protein [Akkermansia glycaniphila]SEI01506.1 Hypothetical protein PYTT_2580 [Akkermansia glycaniphila]